MGDPRIDHRCGAALDHPSHVDPGGRAREAQARQRIVRVACERDASHFERVAQRVGRLAANEAHDRRRRGHREAADARGLGDRAIAKVRVRVPRPVAREVQTIGHRRRRREPGIARAAHADAELDPIARHRRDHGRAGQIVRGVETGLARGHRQIEEEVIVVQQKVEHGRRDRRLDLAHERRRELSAQQRGRRHVAVVAFIAHLQCLAHEHFQIDRARLLQCPRQARPKRAAHPPQPLQDRRVVGAEPQHLAQALVERREGAVATLVVFNDHHWHRGRQKAGHRSDRAKVMARRESHRVGARQRGRLVRVRRPALEQHRPNRSPAHRSTHVGPVDRRARVQ